MYLGRAINRNNASPCRTTQSHFEATIALRESLSTPALLPDGSLKKRVSALEQAMEMAMRRDDVTYQNIIALSKDGSIRQERLQVMMQEETSKLAEYMAAFQREVCHRFELQNAENKRLNQHIASLKQENRQLQTDLVCLSLLVIVFRLFIVSLCAFLHRPRLGSICSIYRKSSAMIRRRWIPRSSRAFNG